ncbi:MAG: hypothetical protein GWO24_24585 [Akkermansiaceae bacterium]|nr:hypothetical protein [Akkermansiaceae bacterium]
MRGYMVDTRGPQGTITRARNALGLPKDVTAEEAMDLLVRSLDGTLRERLVAVAKTGQEGEARAPLGKKGKAQRDANKTLEYLELVYRSSKVKVNGWGSDVAERVAAPQKA